MPHRGRPIHKTGKMSNHNGESFVPDEIIANCSQSCVSSVTREIWDLGSANLYPSIEMVEGLPDILDLENRGEHRTSHVLSSDDGGISSNSGASSHSASPSRKLDGARCTAATKNKTHDPFQNTLSSNMGGSQRWKKSYGSSHSPCSKGSYPNSPTAVGRHPSIGRTAGMIRPGSEFPNEMPIRKVSTHSSTTSSSSPSYSPSSGVDRINDNNSNRDMMYQVQQEYTTGTPPRWSSFSKEDAIRPLRRPIRDDLSYVDVMDDGPSRNHHDHHQALPDDTPPHRPNRRMTGESWHSQDSTTVSSNHSRVSRKNQCNINGATVNSHATKLSTGHGSQSADKHSHVQQRPVEVEIQPGIFAKLRGSEETLQAMERGFVSICPCMSCSCALACIADAEFVLCPDCLVVSRKEDDDYEIGPKRGVGLGLKFEDVPTSNR